MRPILQSGLDALKRTGSLRVPYRTLEARLLVATAEHLLESERDLERDAAAGRLRRALSHLESSSDSSSKKAALLAARAHLGLARLAESSPERLGHCGRALEALENADADHPQSWQTAALGHFLLADTLAFEEQSFSEAREHYRRALPLLYRLRHVGPDGLETLAHWHRHVAMLAWMQGDAAKAEEHARTARTLDGQFRDECHAHACVSMPDSRPPAASMPTQAWAWHPDETNAGHLSPLSKFGAAWGKERQDRDGFGAAHAEHLLGLVALHNRRAPDEALEHLRAAWQAYERSPKDETAAVAVAGDFNREACGLLLADLLFAAGDFEPGMDIIDSIAGDRDSSPSLARVHGLLTKSTVFEQQLGDVERALDAIETARQIAEKSSDPRVRRLGTLWCLTRKAEARSLVESPEVVAADLRSGLKPFRQDQASSAEETLAKARALHLLANLETASSSEQKMAEGHLREALTAYRKALKQGAGTEGELGACYLDLAVLEQATDEGGNRSLPLLRQAAEHLASSAEDEPENWGLLAETHLATAQAIQATGGNEAVATGHFESALETARQAVASGTPRAQLQAARMFAERAQWELERPRDTQAAPESQSPARERAVDWLREACAHYRLGRETGFEQTALRDEVRCRIALAQLLAAGSEDREVVFEQLRETRALLDAVPQQESGWHVEQARLDQFEANLLIDDPATVRQAALRLTSATGHYEQALRQAETDPEAVRHALAAELEVVLFNLADFYATYLQDAGGALEWFRRDLAVHEQLPLAEAERDANQALVYMRMGLVESQLRRDPDRAAEYYRMSLERLTRARAARVSDAELLVRVLVGLGMLGGQLPGMEDNAEKHYREAVALAGEMVPSAPRLSGFEYSARHGLAQQYERRGRYNAAAEQMLRCITLARQREMESLPEDLAYLESLRRLARAEAPRGDGVRTLK